MRDDAVRGCCVITKVVVKGMEIRRRKEQARRIWPRTSKVFSEEGQVMQGSYMAALIRRMARINKITKSLANSDGVQDMRRNQVICHTGRVQAQ